MKTISLTQLLSSCMDASQQGCRIIKDYQQKGVGKGKLKEEGEIKSVLTQADLDAQARIIGSLRETWGSDLLIIGEEDESDAVPTMDGTILRKDILNEMATTVEDEEIPLQELCLFVDPLDGTREFVEGRLQNVASLIGIARNNRTLAGVVGLPFPKDDADVVIHYGVSDQRGSAGSWPSSVNDSSKESEHDGITILTGDSKNPILINATSCAMSMADNPRHLIVGGTAAKLKMVQNTPDSIAILHFVTELWDTCAPESILNSMGGKVTDLFGSPLSHTPSRSFGNVFGVVASSGGKKVSELHDKLCSQMRADDKAVKAIFGKWMGEGQISSPQAVDIVRNLDSIPLSTDEIANFVLPDEEKREKFKLKGYSVPESGAWRGLMSNGGRIILNWEDGVDDDVPSTAFYKRIVMADLAHARDKLNNAPHKLIRDVRSYQVETSFLTSRACQEGLIQEAGLKINKVFGSDLRPVAASLGPKEQLESRFSILLEDFSSEDGWQQQWLLDEEAAMVSLGEFAKMHAYFWHGSDFWRKEGGQLGKELEEVVWPNGGYMQPALQGYDQFNNVASGFEGRLPTFRDDLEKIPELKNVDLESIGSRLERMASKVGQMAHPFNGKQDIDQSDYTRYRTFIHGDPKQANIFFRRQKEEDSLEIALIDFQWSGFGLAATDIAHHMSAALHPSCLSYDGEKESQLLDYYYSCLKKELVRVGVAASEQDIEERIYPRAVLQEQYEIAILDICRMVFAYAWRRWKAESQPTTASLNRNAYNKATESALWLITRCSTLLESSSH